MSEDKNLCGAKTRSGTPCRRAPVPGRTRCKLHGGKSPRGAASPHFKHGRYSKVLPGGLGQRYLESRNNPDLRSLDDDIALADAKLIEAASSLSNGSLGEVWTTLRDLRARAVKAQVEGRNAEAGRLVAQIMETIASGAEDYDKWTEIIRLQNHKRILVESERKALVEAQQMISIEEFMALLGATIEIIRTNVSGPALSTITTAIERHVLAATPGRA